jgi:YHS domain-containing protein
VAGWGKGGKGWGMSGGGHFGEMPEFIFEKKSAMKRILLLLMMSWTVSAIAQKSEVFIKNGAAIRGYDPVAYFTAGKPVKGEEKFSYSWKGGTWQFASSKNLELFKSNPEKYAPQYGGYCAYGMARGYKATTEPDAWSIVGGKLYLNYDLDVQRTWNKDQQGYIKKANANWPVQKDKE